MKTILAFGETLWDLLPSGPALGGAPFNFAARAKELGNWAFVVTRLGRDDLGRKAFARLQQLGMDPSYVQWDDVRPTGTVPVKVDAKGVPDFTILPNVAYDAIEPTPEVLELAGVAECVCFGTLVQRAEGSRRTLYQVLEAAPHAWKVLDLNLRRDCFTPETVRESLARVNILKLNDQEVGALRDLLGAGGGTIPEFAQSLFGGPLTHVVVTLGEKGAYAASSDGRRAYDPGYRVRLVDTCGSGDAFTAGFVHEFLRGKALEECLSLGNVLGAMVAAQAGATTPISPGELAAFREADHERVTDPSLEA